MTSDKYTTIGVRESTKKELAHIIGKKGLNEKGGWDSGLKTVIQKLKDAKITEINYERLKEEMEILKNGTDITDGALEKFANDSGANKDE